MQYAQELQKTTTKKNPTKKPTTTTTLTVWVQMAFPGEYSTHSVEGDGLRND